MPKSLLEIGVDLGNLRVNQQNAEANVANALINAGHLDAQLQQIEQQKISAGVAILPRLPLEQQEQLLPVISRKITEAFGLPAKEPFDVFTLQEAKTELDTIAEMKNATPGQKQSAMMDVLIRLGASGLPESSKLVLPFVRQSMFNSVSDSLVGPLTVEQARNEQKAKKLAIVAQKEMAIKADRQRRGVQNSPAEGEDAKHPTMKAFEETRKEFPELFVDPQPSPEELAANRRAAELADRQQALFLLLPEEQQRILLSDLLDLPLDSTDQVKAREIQKILANGGNYDQKQADLLGLPTPGQSELEAQIRLKQLKQLDAKTELLQLEKTRVEAGTGVLKQKADFIRAQINRLGPEGLKKLELLDARIENLKGKTSLQPLERAALQTSIDQRNTMIESLRSSAPMLRRSIPQAEFALTQLQERLSRLQQEILTAPAERIPDIQAAINQAQLGIETGKLLLETDKASLAALEEPTKANIAKVNKQLELMDSQVKLNLRRAEGLVGELNNLQEAKRKATEAKTSIELEKFEAESFAATVGLEALRQGIDVNDDKALGQFLVNKVDEARQAGRTLFTPPTLEQVKSAIGLSKPDSTREQVFQSQVTVDGETKKVTLRRDPESPTGFSVVEVPGLGPAIGEPTPLISFGTQERKEFREIDNLIGQLQEIDRLFDPSVVGPLDSLKTKALSSLDLLTPQQREFLARLREFEGKRVSETFGATLPPAELERAEKFIPNEKMQDEELRTAIRVTIKNLQRARGILESQGGRGKPSKPGSPAKTAEGRFNELMKQFLAQGLSESEAKVKAFKQLISEGF